MIRNILVLFCFTILFVACNKDKVQPVVIVNVESEYNIDFKEVLTADQNYLSIIVNAMNGYNCDDLDIIYKYTTNLENQTIELRLNGIDVPQSCEEGLSFPEFDLTFEPLEFKTYDLDIKLNDIVVNHEKIIHTSERYFFNFPDHNGVALMHNNLYKIPRDVVWGRICLNHTISPSVLETIEDELNNSTGGSASTLYLEDGYYSYFNVNDNLVELINPTSTNLTLIKPFKFKLSDQSIFQNKIDQLRNQYGADILLEVYSGKGETL